MTLLIFSLHQLYVTVSCQLMLHISIINNRLELTAKCELQLPVQLH